MQFFSNFILNTKLIMCNEQNIIYKAKDIEKLMEICLGECIFPLISKMNELFGNLEKFEGKTDNCHP